MGTVDLRTGMEVLDRAECLRLLATEEVGRVGVVVDGQPEILPVNYALDGERVVFWTAPGSKLAGVAQSKAVVFEVDHLDREARVGWSVIVHGAAAQSRLAPPVATWVRGAWTTAVVIEATTVTGRRSHPDPR